MLLKEGYTGPLVEQLQAKLGMRPDGYYNEKTTRVVRAWQQANKLPVTGDVEDTMWQMLFPSASTIPTAIAEQPVTTEPIVEQPTPKPVEEDGHKQDQAVTPEVNRILSGGSNKNTNRSSSYSR